MKIRTLQLIIAGRRAGRNCSWSYRHAQHTHSRVIPNSPCKTSSQANYSFEKSMYMGIEIPRLYTKEKKKGIEIQNRVKVEFLTEYYI